MTRDPNTLHDGGDPLLRPADLVAFPDLRLGDAMIRPGVRTIEGPLAAVAVEPRVMQVVIALAQAEGSVVTRRSLERRCWGGVHVSENSIDRAIAAVRRAFRESGAGVEIETYARTGYLLRARHVEGEATPSAPATPASGLDRRRFIAAGLAGAASAGVAGLAWRRHGARTPPSAAGPTSHRADSLVRQAERAWRSGLPEGGAQGLSVVREAIALAPDDARAWGWRAILERDAAENARVDRTSLHVAASEAAAHRALLLDRAEGNALAALATLPPMHGDWNGARLRLASVLRAVPGNAPALDRLGVLEMSTGRIRAAEAIVAGLAAADPLAAVFAYKNVYRLWSLGRLAEMDQAADRAFALWPLHPAVWLARVWTLAFTGRAAAADALFAEHAALWRLPPATVGLYRTSFDALARREPTPVALAAAANLRFARLGPGPCVVAVNHLAALGEVDAAFQVLDAYLLRRGPLIVGNGFADAFPAVNEMRWRKTMMLFTPVTAPLRADPRFADLVDRIGLTRAWRISGLGPDHLDGDAGPR